MAIREIEALKEDSKARSAELHAQVLQLSVCEETFRANDSKVSFYTGITNFIALTALFTLLEKCVKHSDQCKLSKF